MSVSTESPTKARIIQFIRDQISSGALGVGMRLPTELQLAREFSVSRPMVREAIAELKADGIAISRRGSGLFVANLSDRNSFKIDRPTVLEPENVKQLFELRQPVEIGASRFAAARRTDEDLARLQQAHDRMVGASDWAEEGVSADLEFHQMIATAAHNAYYLDFLGYLGGLMRESIQIARAQSRDSRVQGVTLEEHLNILKGIEARDPERAAHAMMTHLEGARNRMS